MNKLTKVAAIATGVAALATLTACGDYGAGASKHGEFGGGDFPTTEPARTTRPPRPEPADPYEFVLDSCGEYTRGTVTSHRDFPTSLTIKVTLYSGSNQSGRIVNTGTAYVETQPGRTSEWETYNWGEDFASCYVEIDHEYDF